MKLGSRKWRKLAAGFFSLLMAVGFIPLNGVSAAADDTDAATFRVLTAEEMVAEMGTGINLGNTFDGHSNFTPNETVWQGDNGGAATQEFVDAVHDMGFNTIRVPVTWGTMINEDNTINEAWISRVQDVVDYAVSLDMYVIINIHHDGTDSGWITVDYDDDDAVEALYEKFGAVWTNIAEYFKDYDEHLIFESMNEVGVGGNNTKESYILINHLNQVFVDAVRATGSNNAERWLSVPGRYTDITSTTNENGFALPEDTVENRIFVSVHYYDNNFGLTEDMNVTEWDQNASESLASLFQTLIDTFTSQGVPVILGEYGAVNKNNDAERAYHYEVVNAICKAAGIVPVAWDMGWYDSTQDPDYTFTLVDRKDGSKVFPSVISGILRGSFADVLGEDLLTVIDSIAEETTVVEATALVLSSDTLSMTSGSRTTVSCTVEPSDSNDVIVWSSSDASVATVYNGLIHAKRVGTCTITAVSDSGSVSAQLTLTVTADSAFDSGSEIVCEDEYTVDPGKAIYLNASSDGGTLYYTTQDASVATVNGFGKVVGISEGTTQITVSNAAGVSKSVTVTVASTSMDLNVALCMYNLGDYYGEESGQPIVIAGNGTYEVTINVSDLSADAVAAGVTELNLFGALYIKDYDVLMGNKTKSDISAANITFDAIYVNGTKLTMDDTTPHSAMNGTTFDTGNPINAWTGSLVSEVSIDTSATQCAFTGVSGVETITLVFTLSGIEEELTVPEDYEPQELTVFDDGSSNEEETAASEGEQTVTKPSAKNTDLPLWGAVLISAIELAAGVIAIVIIRKKNRA